MTVANRIDLTAGIAAEPGPQDTAMLAINADGALKVCQAFLASSCSTPLHGAVLDASMGLGVRPGLMSERSH